MNTYYRVVADIDEEQVELYGSFVRQDCADEIEAEREQWLEEGYRGIKIISVKTNAAPDKEVYKGEMHLINK